MYIHSFIHIIYIENVRRSFIHVKDFAAKHPERASLRPEF